MGTETFEFVDRCVSYFHVGRVVFSRTVVVVVVVLLCRRPELALAFSGTA